MVKKVALILFCLVLSGCGSGAVVFAPTPVPPDQSPIRYTHPSGAFSVTLPRQWSIYEQNTTTLATAAFSTPASSAPALLFAVINLGREVNATEFGELVNLYQTQVRSDTGYYSEQSREAMGDGSWRMTGVRSAPGGGTEQLNSFIQRAGTLIGLIDVLMPDDAAQVPEQVQTLQGVINSFTLNPGDATAPLEASDLTTLAFAKDSSLGLLHLATWSTPAGVFFVTGEVANYGMTTISGVPVQIDLRSAEGLSVAGAVDQVMGYGIPAGGFAPFSLRFGQGQPSLASTYTVALGGEDWQPSETVIYGQNEMTWTDESRFDNLNRLIISGTVTNTSSSLIRTPRALVTVFDSAQNVIAAGFADVTDALPPAESAPFEVTLP
ncbi:MAG: FxLYD domain-containing protein, partial [Chloroflexota bacterium]